MHKTTPESRKKNIKINGIVKPIDSKLHSKSDMSE